MLSEPEKVIARKFALNLTLERTRLGVSQRKCILLFRGPRGKTMTHRAWEKWESGEALPHDWVIELILERLKSLDKKKVKILLDRKQLPN